MIKKKKISVFFVVLFYLFTVLPVFSKSENKKEPLPLYIIKKPLKWGKKDLLKLTLIVSGTTFIYLNDEKIKDYVQSIRGDFTNRLSDYTTWFGDGFIVFPAISSLYLTGYLFKYKKLKTASLSAIESALISGIFTTIIKASFHRHRPNTGNPYNTFDGPSFTSKNNSFPSGHTAVAFAIADSFSKAYSGYPVVPVLLYGLAGAVGFSRINDNKHWASDVFLGAAIGITVSRVIYKYNNSLETNLKIFPSIKDKGISITFMYLK